MLAPGRLPGVNKDRRIIAAAVTIPTAAPMKGLSAKNPEICLHTIYFKLSKTSVSQNMKFLVGLIDRVAKAIRVAY